MRSATPREVAQWDELVIANPDGGNILQSRAWGEFKRSHGWHPEYLVHETGGSQIAVLGLRRRTPLLGDLLYLPKGPGVADAAQLGAVAAALRTHRSWFAVKLEPELPAGSVTQSLLRNLGLRRARHDIQITRATIIVHLRSDDDALLASFKPKTRYNIRLAARHGVTVETVPASDANIDVMYSLMAATRDRAGFTLRPRSYFQEYWQLQEAAGQGQLFFAGLDGTVLAGAFITFLGRKGWYKDGGSRPERGEVMAPYALQWEVMRFLRTRGVERYDLVAVPPRDQLSEDHPLYGLYRFKSGFESDITEFCGTLDLVIDPRRYAIWEQVVERLEHQWAYRVRHDLLY
ncbi:MAG: peptidoglycan bridge formation glycyltransferase FemA/FemB family protein [Candidatus Dormibacteraeota bacterium]|nr:peptidoglycan bridge formation glycyltransferase FemA/FemB family protein [Candidatus Dormibacteraeota bacterium]